MLKKMISGFLCAQVIALVMGLLVAEKGENLFVVCNLFFVIKLILSDDSLILYEKIVFGLTFVYPFVKGVFACDEWSYSKKRAILYYVQAVLIGLLLFFIAMLILAGIQYILFNDGFGKGLTLLGALMIFVMCLGGGSTVIRIFIE